MPLARLDLLGQRIAVAGRSAHENVRDVHLFAREADALEQLLEQLARCTDERDALLVLVEARRFADEHQVGIWIAGTEDDLCPSSGQRALRAVGDDLAEGAELVGSSQLRN